MRRGLDALYDGAAWLAALFMIGLLVMVLLSITGRQFNFLVPGTDAYAGYMMAAAGYLALAHTFKRSEHIRVTLLLASLRGTRRRLLERWALAAAAALAGLAAYYSCRLVWQSYLFHDVSTANDATPLWIPQLTMAIGSVVFTIAILDDLVLELRGQRVEAHSDEATRNE
ncbi:MAG TPA: TRAP transporter small permease subunit [Burkholderiaceae bacterium]|nr:TRAP transporter small permease subunit [Burkholderiaceae bacterium]